MTSEEREDKLKAAECWLKLSASMVEKLRSGDPGRAGQYYEQATNRAECAMLLLESLKSEYVVVITAG